MALVPRIFDIAVGLFEKQSLPADVSADDIVDVLGLVEYLRILDGDEKERFYRDLRKTWESDSNLKKEIERYTKDITRKYTLQLLRKYAYKHGITVEVEGRKATLCTLNLSRYRYAERVEAIDEIRILEDVINIIRSAARDIAFTEMVCGFNVCARTRCSRM